MCWLFVNCILMALYSDELNDFVWRPRFCGIRITGVSMRAVQVFGFLTAIASGVCLMCVLLPGTAGLILKSVRRRGCDNGSKSLWDRDNIAFLLSRSTACLEPGAFSREVWSSCNGKARQSNAIHRLRIFSRCFYGHSELDSSLKAGRPHCPFLRRWGATWEFSSEQSGGSLPQSAYSGRSRSAFRNGCRS